MNFGRLLTDAAHALRHPTIWMWGILAAVANHGLALYLPTPTAAPPSLDPALLRQELLAQTQQFFILIADTGQVTRWLLAAVGGLAILWLATALAQGGLIAGVGHSQPTLRPQMRTAVGWLWRFATVDTILLFPPFLITLCMLLAASAGALRLVRQAEGLTADQILQTLAMVGGCVLVLTCLLIPVGLFITLLRHLALRAAVLGQMDTRASIRWAWHALRQQPWPILLIGFILLVLASMGNSLAAPFSGWPVAHFGVGVACTAVFTAYSSAVWTHLYQSLANDIH